MQSLLEREFSSWLGVNDENRRSHFVGSERNIGLKKALQGRHSRLANAGEMKKKHPDCILTLRRGGKTANFRSVCPMV